MKKMLKLQVKEWQRRWFAHSWCEFLCSLPEDLRHLVYTAHHQTRLALDWHSLTARCEKQQVCLYPWRLPRDEESYFLAPTRLYWRDARLYAIDTRVIGLPEGSAVADHRVTLILSSGEFRRSREQHERGKTLKTIY